MSISFRKLKHNKDDFISVNNIYKIQWYLASAGYLYEDIVIFVNSETLKSIKKYKYYKVKAIDLSKNSITFDDGKNFLIEKIDRIEKLI